MNRFRGHSCLALIALCTPALAAAPSTPRFKDVPANHWAATAIGRATQKGLMKPAASDKFAPNQPVTRAELASILVRVIDYLESRGPVKISSSPAKPEVPSEQRAVLARFGKKHAYYQTLDRLVNGGYLVPDLQGRAFMPTPENLNKPASAEEVAAAFAGVMIRITEKRAALETPETLQEGDRPETRRPGDDSPRELHKH